MTKPRYEEVHRVCKLCGKEITGPFGTYRFGIGNGMICYDCDAKVTAENRRRRQAVNSKVITRKAVSLKDFVPRRVKVLHKSGLNPTEIAKELHIEPKEVYEILNKRR